MGLSITIRAESPSLTALLVFLVHLRQVHPLKAKRCINIVDTPFCYSVGGDGFEPPKA